MIVLPGLVETHWHMWSTLLRSFSGDKPENLYFPNILAFGKHSTPKDIYQGTRLGAAEALHAGMTTVHDWAHNLRSPAHAEAELRALRDVGIRARFSYSWYQRMPVTETLNLTDIERLHRNWASYSNEGLIHLGLGWRGMYSFGDVPEDIYRKEFDTARRLTIPVAVHLSSRRTTLPTAGSRCTQERGFWGRTSWSLTVLG
jgi:5-methylthioadenosine/S-adenosylhomocysteine deaminase